MIKQIPLSQLIIGMYVHDLNCSWLQHPFTVNRFMLRSQDQLDRIEQAGIKEIAIDTDKGLDVGEESAPLPPEVAEVTSEPPLAKTDTTREITLQDELPRAAKVKKEAIKVMTEVMENIRRGNPVVLDKLTPVIEEMSTSIINNSDALLGLMQIRKADRYIFEHAIGVSVLLITFGHSLALGTSELKQLGLGGLLLDIGKVMSPPAILNKPGRLSDAEFAIMQKHVSTTLEILSAYSDIPDTARNMAAEHHERLDGSGYPRQLGGDDISFYGQMAAIADVFDAKTSNRAYRKGASPHTILKKLVLDKNRFNPELVHQFVHCLGIYPIGTLVSLSNGKLAVVCETSKKGLLSPKIRVIFDTTKRQLLTPVDIDLATDESGIKIVGAVEAEKWRLRPEEYLDQARYKNG